MGSDGFAGGANNGNRDAGQRRRQSKTFIKMLNKADKLEVRDPKSFIDKKHEMMIPFNNFKSKKHHKDMLNGPVVNRGPFANQNHQRDGIESKPTLSPEFIGRGSGQPQPRKAQESLSHNRNFAKSNINFNGTGQNNINSSLHRKGSQSVDPMSRYGKDSHRMDTKNSNVSKKQLTIYQTQAKYFEDISGPVETDPKESFKEKLKDIDLLYETSDINLPVDNHLGVESFTGTLKERNFFGSLCNCLDYFEITKDLRHRAKTNHRVEPYARDRDRSQSSTNFFIEKAQRPENFISGMTKSFSAKVFENEPGARRLEKSGKKHQSSKPDEFYAGVKMATPDIGKQSDKSSEATYGVYQDMKAQCRVFAKADEKVSGYSGSDPNYNYKLSAKDF